MSVGQGCAVAGEGGGDVCVGEQGPEGLVGDVEVGFGVGGSGDVGLAVALGEQCGEAFVDAVELVEVDVEVGADAAGFGGACCGDEGVA